MACTELDLEICQGVTYNKSFEYRESDGVTPVDLTGYTARMQLRKFKDSRDFLIELTTENGRISITPLTGLIVLSLSATTTASLDYETAKYDLELINSTGVVLRLIEGNIPLNKEVTK